MKTRHRAQETMMQRKNATSMIIFLVASATTSLNCNVANAAQELKTQTPLIVGHRGGRKWAPENTLASFKQCVDHGYALELDIHKCKSGELVVIHDDDVNRTTDGTGMVKDKTLSELRCLSAGKWYDEKFAAERVPLLSEVLEVVNGRVPIQIEIKNQPVKYEGIENDLAALLKSYKAPETLTVISFDHEVLHRFHELAPEYKVGFLDGGIPYNIGAYAKTIGATAWHPEYSALRLEDIQRAHKAGIRVSPWTVNDAKAWKEMIRLGVDAIVTDDPVGLETLMKDEKPTTGS